MHFCSNDRVKQVFEGKKVVIVGSGPSTKTNEPDFIDSHDVVVRVNNYKIVPRENTGRRTDVHYSFYGTSIKKTAAELKADGVYLCMCKCPDEKFIESRWHERNGKLNGIDFRYIYQFRKDFWFTDTFVPSLEDFLAHFELLGKHVPTTGFSAILDVLKYNPESIYITGFDFFQSRVHNFNERWRRNNPSDPIGHRPEAEFQWLLKNYHKYPIDMDVKLKAAIKTHNRIRKYGL